jgi:hypothetical protein
VGEVAIAGVAKDGVSCFHRGRMGGDLLESECGQRLRESGRVEEVVPLAGEEILD